MWIYVPDEDGKEAWSGTISRNKSSKSWWRFELIRHVDNLADPYSTMPFDEQRPVIGLLDYQTLCTVIRPLVTHTDPGSVGDFFNFHRTRIEGECDSLLTGLAIRDPQEEIFLGVKFISEAFSAWFAPPSHRHNFDFKTRAPGMTITPDKSEKFVVPNVGTVECTTGARFVDEDVHSTSIKSSSLFILSFEKAQSLEQTREISFGLERLFGFLIGHRGELPTFSVWIDKQYSLDKQNYHHSGTLEIGGAYSVEGKPPHPMRCIHLAGSKSASLEIILEKFFGNRDDIVTRIHAVEFCRFFTSNLNDRFSVIMPVLEEYLKKRYTEPDEQEYLQHKQKFFDYIDACADKEIQEFSKKHIKLQEEKAASLSTLLERAIKHLNDKGFRIPVKLAKDIQRRRGRVFHSAPSMTADDVHLFSVEITAAVALLLFHTFEDIGIDPAELVDRYSALSDMGFFMREPPIPERDPNAAIMTLAEALKQMNDGARGDESSPNTQT